MPWSCRETQVKVSYSLVICDHTSTENFRKIWSQSKSVLNSDSTYCIQALGKYDQGFEKSKPLVNFQRKHFYSEMTLPFLNSYSYLKVIHQTKCFVSDQIKCFSLKKKKALSVVFTSPTSYFSLSILFVVSCQAPLIQLCIKCCNYSYSLFSNPERVSYYFLKLWELACVDNDASEISTISDRDRASSSGCAANAVAPLRSYLLIVYSFSNPKILCTMFSEPITTIN